jgi:hypothetical protein
MCNCKGSCGCNITQITKGEKGDNGTNGVAGTNAFKFVKEFDYDGDTPIDILYSEITTCNPIPEGCYADGTVYDDIVDYHFQLWEFIPAKDAVPPQWKLKSAADFTYQIDTITGDAVLEFPVEVSAATYRLVILA